MEQVFFLSIPAAEWRNFAPVIQECMTRLRNLFLKLS
jgi:hypothetical protein